MTTTNTKQNTERLAQARESFSGRLLTDRQFHEAMALTGIIEREIARSGAFKDKLGDYAHAFARSEKFDAMKAETVLRDLFKERVGQTMNQMREQFAQNAENLSDEQRQRAYDAALAIGDMIERGDKIAFNRAYAHQAQALAQEIGITDNHAKTLMTEEFRAAENTELYDWGKALEEKFYRPQIEAEARERQRSGRDRDTGELKGERSRARSASDRGNSERAPTQSRRQRGPELRR